MSAEKRSVSADAELFAAADKRWKDLRYANFSRYVQELMSADVENRRPHVKPSKYLSNPRRIVRRAAALAVEQIKKRPLQ